VTYGLHFYKVFFVPVLPFHFYHLPVVLECSLGYSGLMEVDSLRTTILPTQISTTYFVTSSVLGCILQS